MQKNKDRRLRMALKTFRARKVCTIPQLADLLECSAPTVRRRLKGWSAHTSYNKNGRYYALPDVVSFDANGLWRYGTICFSRHGNLRQTLIGVVGNSRAGLCAAEVRELLGVEPRSFLSLFRKKKKPLVPIEPVEPADWDEFERGEGKKDDEKTDS